MNIDKTLVIGLAAGAGALTAIGAGIAAMFTGKSQVSSKQPENETPMWDPQGYFLYNGKLYEKSRYIMNRGKPRLRTAVSTASSDERKTRTPEQKKQTSSSSSSVDLENIRTLFPSPPVDEWRFPSNEQKKQTSSSSSSVDLSEFLDAQSEDEWRFPSNMFKTPSPYYSENPFSNTVLTDRAENKGGN